MATDPDYFSATATGSHGLNSLSNLYAAFGIDVTDNLNVGNTGATYDAMVPVPVPEPGAAALFGVAGAALLAGRRRR